MTIFSAAGFEALAADLGTTVGISFHPSRFRWRGIDPLTVEPEEAAA